MRHWFVRSVLSIQLVAALSSLSRADESAGLVRIYLTDKNTRPIVAEITEENDKQIAIYDLSAATTQPIPRDRIQRVVRDVSEQSAAATVDVSHLLAWKVRKALPINHAVGKIAKIDQSTVYVNLGGKDRLEVGTELLVYRGSEEVHDPDTNAVLDRVRRKVGTLSVVEVRSNVSKCVHLGDVDAHYEIGDEIESKGKVTIAVLPILDNSGGRTPVGDSLTESLTSGLVAAGIPVVERSRLSDALAELSAQQTDFYSADGAQKLGKLLGTTAILVGSITDNGKTFNAKVRLTRVSSGEILFSSNQTIPAGKLPAAEPETTQNAPVRSSDLFSEATFARATKKGHWTLENGHWLLTQTPGGGMVTVPYQLPAHFRLKLQVRPSGVGESTCVALYLHSGIDCIVQMASDGSCVIAEGKDPRSDHTAKYGPVLEDNKVNTIECDVRDGRLAVTVKGRPLLTYRNPKIGSASSKEFSIGAVGDWTVEGMQVDVR